MKDNDSGFNELDKLLNKVIIFFFILAGIIFVIIRIWIYFDDVKDAAAMEEKNRNMKTREDVFSSYEGVKFPDIYYFKGKYDNPNITDLHTINLGEMKMVYCPYNPNSSGCPQNFKSTIIKTNNYSLPSPDLSSYIIPGEDYNGMSGKFELRNLKVDSIISKFSISPYKVQLGSLTWSPNGKSILLILGDSTVLLINDAYKDKGYKLLKNKCISANWLEDSNGIICREELLSYSIIKFNKNYESKRISYRDGNEFSGQCKNAFISNKNNYFICAEEYFEENRFINDPLGSIVLYEINDNIISNSKIQTFFPEDIKINGEARIGWQFENIKLLYGTDFIIAQSLYPILYDMKNNKTYELGFPFFGDKIDGAILNNKK